MQLDSVSYAAYVDGRDNGTIKATEQEIVALVLKQEVVSFCSEKASYTFDNLDLIED